MLTKDTESKKGVITVKVGKEIVPATLVQRFPKRDLALFAADAEGRAKAGEIIRRLESS